MVCANLHLTKQLSWMPTQVPGQRDAGLALRNKGAPLLSLDSTSVY